MSFDCPTGDGQPQAGAAPFTGACFVNPIESVEDVGLISAGIPGPRSMTSRHDFLSSPRCTRMRNATLDGRIFDCIIQKIDDGLTKNQAIGGNNQITVSFHVYLLPFLLRQNFESGSRLLGNGKERSINAMKLYVTGIRTRKNQQAFNEAR